MAVNDSGKLPLASRRQDYLNLLGNAHLPQPDFCIKDRVLRLQINETDPCSTNDFPAYVLIWLKLSWVWDYYSSSGDFLRSEVRSPGPGFVLWQYSTAAAAETFPALRAQVLYNGTTGEFRVTRELSLALDQVQYVNELPFAPSGPGDVSGVVTLDTVRPHTLGAVTFTPVTADGTQDHEVVDGVPLIQYVFSGGGVASLSGDALTGLSWGLDLVVGKPYFENYGTVFANRVVDYEVDRSSFSGYFTYT